MDQSDCTEIINAHAHKITQLGWRIKKFTLKFTPYFLFLAKGGKDLWQD